MSTKRTDANQSTIAADLRRAGCQVKDLHIVGKGVPDLLVAHPQCAGNTNFLFEVKTQRGRLTPDEDRFFNEWPGQKDVIHSAEDALRIMGLMEAA